MSPLGQSFNFLRGARDHPPPRNQQSRLSKVIYEQALVSLRLNKVIDAEVC